MAKKTQSKGTVTISIEEYERLTERDRCTASPSIQVPEGYIVLADSYYKELYGYQCELAKLKESETERKFDGLLAETVDFLALKTDAEKWRAMSKEAQLLPPISRADAELGALVRQMGTGDELTCLEDGTIWLYDSHGERSEGKTPEEALRAALKETE